jgi:Amt family ammonium transporter
MSGAWILGPRIGKFVVNPETGKTEPQVIPGSNAILAALGVLLLWFGFFPFNAGAGYSVAETDSAINTGRAVVVTCLTGASGSMTLLTYSIFRFKQWDLGFAMNGLLAGMVASCSGVNVYAPWVAVVFIGPLGAIGYYLHSFLVEYVLHIDDPLNASAVHMGAGIVGLLSVGFFAGPQYVDHDEDRMGVIFGGNGRQLALQLYGLAVYFAWSFGTSTILFFALRRLGWLRVSEEVERMGMDIHHHGGKAIPDASVYFARESIARPSVLDPSNPVAGEDGSNHRASTSRTSTLDVSIPEETTVPESNGTTMRKRPSALLPGQI